MVLNKALVLVFLGFAILLGTSLPNPRVQNSSAPGSVQASIQRSLTRALDDDENGTRQLFRLGDEAVSPLIKVLSDPDAEKRGAAARGLAYIGTPQALQALRNAIKTENDEEVRAGISCFLAGRLVDTKSEADLNFLRSLVENAHRDDADDWDLPGFCAALALGMRGGSDSLLLLRKAAITDEQEEIDMAIRWMENQPVRRRVTAGPSVSDKEEIKRIVLDDTFFAEEKRDETSVELTFNRVRNKVLVSLEIYQHPKSARGYDLVLAKKNGEWRVVGIWFAWIA